MRDKIEKEGSRAYKGSCKTPRLADRRVSTKSQGNPPAVKKSLNLLLVTIQRKKGGNSKKIVWGRLWGKEEEGRGKKGFRLSLLSGSRHVCAAAAIERGKGKGEGGSQFLKRKGPVDASDIHVSRP